MKHARIFRFTLAVLLVCLATPAWSLQPCAQSTAQSVCTLHCSLQGSSCTSAWLDFKDGCQFAFKCAAPGGTQYVPCSCASGCFLGGTEITMADGTTKDVELITAGDLIQVYDEASGELTTSAVGQVHAPSTWEFYLRVNATLRLTPVHPVLSDGRWVEVGRLGVGDTLTGADGSPILIESIEVVNEPVAVFNFAVHPYQSYVAGGIIVHNKGDIPHQSSP